MKLIELININKEFKQGKTSLKALSNCNFVAEKGEFIAIIGPSGSGKSTFLTITGILQSQDSGDLFIGGENILKKSKKEKTRIRFDKISFILQSSNLIPFLNVKDQLKIHDVIAGEKFRQKDADDLFKTLEISELKHKFPNSLSGGEKQRVAIARALYHKPKIILADEPTASLDTKKAKSVVKLLAKLAKKTKTSIIMVTHDERMIKYCDSVYTMKDGVLAKDEKHKKSK